MSPMRHEALALECQRTSLYRIYKKIDSVDGGLEYQYVTNGFIDGSCRIC